MINPCLKCGKIPDLKKYDETPGIWTGKCCGTKAEHEWFAGVIMAWNELNPSNP